MSTIKSNNVQIGQSGTATNNFVLAVPAVPDGTLKIQRGNVGATTQDVLSIAADGSVTALGLSLVSGTNIKTVNSQSIVGSGNITVGELAVVNVAGTTQTAVAGSHYVLNNAAATTVTLPAGVEGAIVAVTTTGTLTTNVIAPNGANTIMEVAENMTIDRADTTVTLRFLSNSWRVI